MAERTHLVDRLGLEFDQRERELGALFLREDRAALEDEGPDRVEASIRHFKRTYWVWVERRGDRVETGCDCPHLEETGRGCEHLWALRLLLEGAVDTIADDDPEFAPLLPRWRLLPSSSLRRNRLVLALLDDEARPLPLDQDAWIRVEDEAQIAALRELAPFAGGFREARRGGGFTEPRGPFEIPAEKCGRVLLAAAGTERLEVADEGATRGQAVASLPGEELELLADIRVAGSSERLIGWLKGASLDLDIGEVEALVPGPRPWVVVAGRLHPVRARGAGAWARSLRREGGIELPPERLESFLREVLHGQALPRLLRDGSPLPLIEATPRARLEIRPGPRLVTANLAFRYEGAPVAPGDAGEIALGPGMETLIARDRRAEGELVRELLDAGFAADTQAADGFAIEAAALPEALRQLLPGAVEVVSRGALVRPARLGSFSIRAGQDWFELASTISRDDGATPPSLAELLAAFRPEQPLIALDDGSLLALEEADRKRLAQAAPLAAMAADHDGALRMRSEQALLADLVLRGMPELDSSALESARDRLLARLELARSTAGPGFRAELRPYQESGLAWLEFVAEAGLGGCLADEMGLGKTVQIIAFLDKRRRGTSPRGPALVVAPLSLLANWSAELARFAPELEVLVHAGPERDIAAIARCDVALTSYGTMRRDVDALASLPLDCLVLDEAQAIKNRDSQTAQAARKLRARCRFALSGTPVENHLDDLWALFEFLAPELFLPGRALDGVRRLGREADPRELARALRPVMLRRRKEDVLGELPELVEQTILCSMTEKQERLYGDILAAARREMASAPTGHRRPALMLETLLRLRQAACHPALLGDETGAGSGKIDLLVDRLVEAATEGRKALVFSQFRGLLDLVAAALEERGSRALRLDGRTRDRATVCQEFQEGSEALPLLVSLKVGGTGLNLTAAEEVFILDPWWNPAVEAQAVARAHRIGQTSRVHAMRLVMRDTVEERIVKLQESKRELAEAIVGEAIEGMGALDAEDIRQLLS